MLALQLAALLLAAAPQKLDLVIEHGRVVDGTGSPWFRADVGIRGDRITRMGDLHDVPAKLRIDARDHVVAPGFIDLLGQSELAVLVDPRAESKIRQGITTELTGELGTVAPVAKEILGGLGPWLSAHQIKIDWKDLDGYWKRFRAVRPAINVGTMVSTGQVRAAVMGEGSEAPTPEQLLRMQIEVQKAMRQGAFGVSAALAYPPTSYQTTDELVQLLAKLSRPTENRFGLAYESGDPYFHAGFLFGFGGALFDSAGKVQFDGPGFTESLAFVKKLQDARYIPDEATGAKVKGLFNDGRAAMVISGP
jgi:dihydroorotase/N-acyl-D-amino-acid deacylase